MTDDSVQAAIGSVLLVLGIGMFVYLIAAVITFWQLYSKAGRPGWAAIVPIYGLIVMAQIAGKSPWLGVGAAAANLLSIPMPFLAVVGLGLNIYLLVVFAQKYDRGVGFWLAVVLLPVVSVFLAKNANYHSDAATQPASPATPPAPTQTPATPAV